MNKKFIIIGLSLPLLCLGLGWWSADLEGTSVPAKADQWHLLTAEDVGNARYLKVAKNLHESDIFPLTRAEEEKLENLQVVSIGGDDPTRSDFPTIVGASVLNGVPYVHLRLEDDSFIRAKSGDELETGWKLLSVDLEQVSAVYDDEEHEFWITNYDLQLDENDN